MSGGRLGLLDIHEDASLFDRGYLDSFSYVEFLAFIERTHGVRIDDSQLAGHLGTIAAMAEHIVREQAARAE
jgi:acyl carrier protein